MIANFPDPYLDELVISLLARYRWSLPFLSQSKVMRQLFNRSSMNIPLELGASLRAFVDAVGRENGLNVEILIHNHTLLALYAPFLPPDRVEVAQRVLAEPGFADHAVRTGIIRGNVYPAEHFRFCPRCAAQERARTGEAYWHRLHQVAGVFVCPEHSTLLEESEVPMRFLYRPAVLVAAEAAIPVTAPRELESGNSGHAAMLRLARGAAWLLTNWQPGTELTKLRERYRSRTLSLGYSTAAGSILWKKLIPAFRSRYSEDLLKDLQCSLPTDAPRNRDHWIAEILSHGRQPQPPIRHLLLLDFLELTAKEFFTSEPNQLFGKGPWTCMNPVCPRTGKAIIEQIKLEATPTGTIGVLLCPQCGQVSCRKTLRGVERQWIRERGPLWESALANMCEDPDSTFYLIAKRLGASPMTVEHCAERLGLRMAGSAGNDATSSPATPILGKREKRIQASCISRKAEWLALREHFPAKSTTELISEAPACYSFLYHHEREWLKKNCPASRRHPPIGRAPRRLDELDAQLSRKVGEARSQIMNAPGRIRRVSKFGLLRKLSQLANIVLSRLNLERLPLTAKVVMDTVESEADYAERKMTRDADSTRERAAA